MAAALLDTNMPILTTPKPQVMTTAVISQRDSIRTSILFGCLDEIHTHITDYKLDNSIFKCKEQEHVGCPRCRLAKTKKSFPVLGIEMYNYVPCALHWAEKGIKIAYVTKREFQLIPDAIVVDVPEVKLEVLNRIHIIYLPTQEDLLLYLIDLPVMGWRPKAYIIDGFDDYWTDDAMSAASTCAALMNRAHQASRNHNDNIFVLTALDRKLGSVLKMFFDNIWDMNRSNENVLLKKLHAWVQIEITINNE